MCTKSRGRGRGRAKIKNERVKPGRCGSASSTITITSMQSHQSIGGEKFHSNIPATARLPCDDFTDTLWVDGSNAGRTRQMMGDTVMVKQPKKVAQEQQIIVLSDQMLFNFVNNDKYIKCVSMPGYALRDFTNDITDQSVDLNFVHVILFLGTLQLGVFEPKNILRHVGEFVKAVLHINPCINIVLSGLVPRPLDHPHSKSRCHSYSKTYQQAAQEWTQKGRRCDCQCL